MEQLKRLCKKIFFLKPLPTVLIAIPSFVFVCIVLRMEDHSALSYVAYLLSAYAMMITVTGMPRIIDAIRTGIREMALVKKIRSTPLGKRLLEDVVFRSEVTLHGGLLINLLYVALNLFSGIRYRSACFPSCGQYWYDTSTAGPWGRTSSPNGSATGPAGASSC